MIRERKFKNKGVKNFKFFTLSSKLVGIYLYLSRPSKSDCQSTIECDIYIHNFCQLHKFEGNRIACAVFVHENWDDFQAFVKSKKRKS